MHSYSTDSADRKHIPFFLAAVAIAASYAVSRGFAYYSVELPWWAPPLDTMAFYGLFYWIFDHYVWRWRLLRTLGVIKIPDMAGEWQGSVHPRDTEGVSSGLTEVSEMRVSIRQTWQHLSVRGSTAKSHFQSRSGSVTTDGGATLGYEYISEPEASAPATMHIHRGTVRLVLAQDGRTLRGEYYSGRDRQNIGSMQLEKIANTD